MKRIGKIVVCLIVAFGLVYSPVIIPEITGIEMTENSYAASIKLNKTKATVVVGRTVQLKVNGTSKKVTWTTSNKNIATVNNKGKVVAKKAGKATITAKVSGKKLKCNVTVKELPTLNKTKANILIGDSVKLKVTGTTKVVKWKSSDENIVTVSNNGYVCAVGLGTAKVTATVGNKNLVCNIVVEKIIFSNKEKVIFDKGEGEVPVKITWNGNGSIHYDVENPRVAKARWADEWDGRVITLYIICGEPGTTTVTVSGEGTDEVVNINVVVNNILSVDKTEVVFDKRGQTDEVMVTYKGNDTVSWSSSNRNVVTAKWSKKWENNTTALILEAVNPGEAKVTISNKTNDEEVVINVVVKPDMTMDIDECMGRYADYNYSGSVNYVWYLDGISYEVTNYSPSSDTYTVKLYFKGEKGYDDEGSRYSRTISVGWKLYDADGIVIDSGTSYTPALATGERFKSESYIFDVPAGHHVLKVLNTR